MATSDTAGEADIRRLIANMAEAIRAADLEGLRAHFAPDVVSFDVGPQLQSVGVEAKLQNWLAAFTMLKPPRDYEIRDLTVTVADDVAFAHSFNRISGA